MGWIKESRGDYTIFTESGLTLADNAGDNAGVVTVSSAIPVGVAWENLKFPVTCKITTGTTDATTAVDMALQTSATGVTTDDVLGTASAATPSWVDSAAIDTNIATGVVGNYSAECDASSVSGAYARFVVKAGADDLNGDAGRCSISFALKTKNMGLDGVDGIGADPS